MEDTILCTFFKLYELNFTVGAYWVFEFLDFLGCASWV